MFDSHLFAQAENTVRSQVVADPFIGIDTWNASFMFFAIIVALVAYSIWNAWRDQKNQSLGMVAGFALLRLGMLAILLMGFLNLERKQEEVRREPSTIMVLIDNSLSMNLKATDSDAETRFAELKRLLRDAANWERWRQDHQILFYHLSEEVGFQEFGRLPQVPSVEQSSSDKAPPPIGFWFILLAGILLVFSATTRHDSQIKGTVWASGVVVLVFGMTWVVSSFIANESIRLPWQNGSQSVSAQIELHSSLQSPLELPWDELNSELSTTKLVDSTERLLDSIDLNSLASVWLFSDGSDTENGDFARLSQRFSRLEVPVLAVGFGSAEQQDNLTLLNFMGPRKIYRGDGFSLQGQVLLRSQTEQAAEIEVKSWKVDNKGNESPSSIAPRSQSFNLRPDRPENVELEYSNLPTGTIRFQIRAKPLANEIDVTDNTAWFEVEVVDKKAKVLLLAGGPSREFKFLRDQLYRDPNVVVHVLLQSADEGSDQESDVQLVKFPLNREELESYDCLVAFDPDWTELTANQTEALRRWVAQDSGGLIVVTGPVNTPVWTSRPRNDEVTRPIHRLYPVSFYSQASGSIRLGRFGGEEAFPLLFTRSSQGFDFLRLNADPNRNRQLWDGVKVFGYYAVNEEKAGAEVIARFSDPLTGFGGKQPIYMASHLYGSGRVFFQASGELWRTRGIGPEFFEKYYARLIRWTSQGRLSRKDDRYSLTIDKNDPKVGDFLNVRVTANRPGGLPQDPTLMKLTLAKSVDGDNRETAINLRPINESQNSDVLGARFRVEDSGLHELKLVIADANQTPPIRAKFRASLPNAELKNPLRNDEGLSMLARSSGGKYVRPADFENGSTLADSIDGMILDHSYEVISPLSSDRSFKQKYFFSLFVCLFVCFSINWIFRRLNQLA